MKLYFIEKIRSDKTENLLLRNREGQDLAKWAKRKKRVRFKGFELQKQQHFQEAKNGSGKMNGRWKIERIGCREYILSSLIPYHPLHG